MHCSELTEDGQLWVQYVSSAPASRLDVITLQERLDQQLQQRQASGENLESSRAYAGGRHRLLHTWQHALQMMREAAR